MQLSVNTTQVLDHLLRYGDPFYEILSDAYHVACVNQEPVTVTITIKPDESK